MKQRQILLAITCALVVGGCQREPATSRVLPSGTTPAAADPWAAKPPEPGTAAVPVKAAVETKGKLTAPLIWSASKDGKTTYFLGTIHLGIDAKSRLPDWVWALHKAAPVFAMETNIVDPALLTAGVRKNGGTLREEVGDAYWTKLENALGASTANFVNKMNLATATAMVAIRGLPMTAPMDAILSSDAKELGKELVFLEPASKQLSILDKWMDLQSFKEILDDLPGTEKRNKELLAAYEAGDLTLLERVERDGRAEFEKTRPAATYDAMMKELLYDRNASWIDAIEKLHQTGNGFVAVGAMHLVGTGSVLELLQKRGFTITRVSK
jgi:uncharacterized protein